METMAQLRDRVFDVAKVQAVYMDSLLPEGKCPRTFQGEIGRASCRERVLW